MGGIACVSQLLDGSGRTCERDSTGAAAAPGRHAAAAATKTAHAAPRAPFPLTAAGQEAPQAMARRMSTIAGMRSGEQLTSEDAVEATAGEKAEDAAEATADEKSEDATEATEAAEATADEKDEATAVGLGTADAPLRPFLRRGLDGVVLSGMPCARANGGCVNS